MPASNQFFRDRRNPIQAGDQFRAQQVGSVMTLVPNHPNAARFGSTSPTADVYLQRLEMFAPTRTVNPRPDHASADTMDATLEKRLVDRMANDASIVIVSLLLLFVGAAAIGVLIGAVIGRVVLPADLLALGLFVTLSLSMFILGVGLGFGLGH